ncbi:glycosyltransferase [Salmonirosea aquatica]
MNTLFFLYVPPRLYIISYWSYNNPKTFVGALRPYRMSDFFRQKGWDVTLVTSTCSSGPELTIPESRWMRWSVLRAFPPDYTFLWALKVIWVLRKKIKYSPIPVYLLTTCPPNGLVIAGIVGKFFFPSQIKWILDFRDLWTQHPLYAPPITKRYLDPFIERWAMYHADHIVCNTVWDQNHWSGRFPGHRSKLLTVANGFDHILQNQAVHNIDNLRFVYTGGTTAGQATRWIHSLLNCFQEQVVTCDFYGEYDTFMDTSPCISYRGVVEPEEIPLLLTAYRFGFIYLPKGSEMGGRVAQKFYDYLGSGVIPICYRPSQEMRRLIGELRTGVCISENDSPYDTIRAIQIAEFRASAEQLALLQRNTQFEKLYNSLPSLS